jgi:type I restriction enzyme S subunit
MRKCMLFSGGSVMQNECFPSAIPEWGRHPISSLAEINPPYPVSKAQEVPFVEMASVAEQFGGIQRFDWRRLEGSGLTRFKIGDTLFAKITPCPENGKVAYVRTLPAEYGIGSTEFIVLSPKEECDPRFLYHLVCHHAVRGRAASRMEVSTGRQRVPDDVFQKRLLVPKPTKDDQTRIASVLDSVEAVIEALTRSIAASQQLAASLVMDAFNRQHAPTQRLREFIADVRYGTSKASNERAWGCPTLRIPNVIGDRLSLTDVTYVDAAQADVERLALVDGDLLLVRTNGNPNYVGRSAVFKVPDERVWIYASYLIRVRLKNGLLPEYLNVFLGTERGRRELLRLVTTSAGNHNINSNSIRLLSLPIPISKKHQEEIIEIANLARARTATLISKRNALRKLQSALTRDLISGHVAVNNIGIVSVGAV